MPMKLFFLHTFYVRYRECLKLDVEINRYRNNELALKNLNELTHISEYKI